MTDEDILAKGRAAEALLTNETLQEALETLATDAINRWRQTPARDLDGREILYAHVTAIDGLRSLLEAQFEHAKAVMAQREKAIQRASAKADRSNRTFGLNIAR